MKPFGLTTKQIEIINYLLKFRFLNRIQIQTLLNHKDPRRINAWLTDLTNQKFLGRIYSHKFGENTKPAIYYLGLKSLKLLKQQKDVNPAVLNRLYREKQRSVKFIENSIFITDFYLHLLQSNPQNKTKLHFFTKTNLEGLNYLPLPHPDAYIAIEELKTKIKRYFLEIFQEDSPRFVMCKRIQQYYEYFETDLWQNNTHHPFPSVLIICPDNSTKKFLGKFILQTFEEEMGEIELYLATKDEVKHMGTGENVWKKVE